MSGKLAATPRRWLLSAHILLSVGWFGVATCFLVLSIVATISRDVVLVRAAYTAIELLDKLPIRPMAIGTAATGIILSLRTGWGLFGFYWQIVKEILTVLSIGIGVAVINGAPGFALSTLSVEGLGALSNPTFSLNHNLLLLGVVFQVAALAASVVISVFKPWRRRGGSPAR